jgi:DeoR family glycerol-3-phosphate regulon repressor
MAADGLVRKVHGGVVRPEPQMEPGFHDRLMQHAEAKRAIAQTAATLVRDGDSLMLDTGSTTTYVARALRQHRNLLVVTNSVDIARALASRNGNRVYLAGGELRADDGAILGPPATAFVEQFRVRLAFLSIAAIDLEDGLMDYHLAEAEFSRVVMRRAETRVIVADRSKFGRRALVTVGPPSAVDTLITDAPPPPPFPEWLQKANVAILAPERAAAD